MKWQSIENRIKTTLHGHRSEVDADAIWAAIEPQVDAINRRKKRRGFFLWFWLTGIVLAGGTLGYFYQNESPAGPEQLAEMPVAAQTRERMAEPPALAAPAASVQPNENTPSQTTNRSGETAANSAVNDVLNQTEAQVLNKKPLQNTGQATAANQKSALLESETTIGQHDAQPAVLSAEPSLLSAPQNLTSVPGMLPFLSLAMFDLDETNLPDLPQREQIILPEAPPSAPTGRKSFSFSAGMQGSVSFIDRKLESDSFHLDLLDLRNKTERELEAIQAGLRLTVRHSPGLGLTSGVNYTQINERFRYNTSVTTVDSTYGIQYYVITINNDTVPYYGDVPIERKTTFRKEYYNKYRLIDVPVLLDYRFEGRDFSVGAQAGVFVNVSLAAKGRFLASEDTFEDLSDMEIFKSSVGLSYYFGLSAGYLINENIELTISPFLRHFPKSFTESSYGLTQRYNLYGVNVGAVYHFD